ncbi:MAG TPA: PIN domain-containing protein [Thermoanaerobaculia bacterium]|nr:PIN domain-containing protein [Thermoanaerobaculia bacterium]
MRSGEAVFVDTGAWIALALTADPYHPRALEAWEELERSGARLFTSIPVVLETFTFLERNTRRDVALAWKESLDELERFRILECTAADLEAAFRYFERRDLHKLSAVDATSFVLMKRSKIRVAFTFDHHFAAVGFRLVG